MGMPGYADIEISTKVAEEEYIYSRSIKLVKWMGLNGLSLCYDFDPEFHGELDLAKIMKRFIDVADGVYRITRVKQPSDDPYDYEWEIVDKNYDD